MKNWRTVRSVAYMTALMLLQAAFLAVCFVNGVASAPLARLRASGGLVSWVLGQGGALTRLPLRSALAVFIMDIEGVFLAIYAGLLRQKAGWAAARNVMDVVSSVLTTAAAVLLSSLPPSGRLEGLTLLAWSLTLAPILWLLSRREEGVRWPEALFKGWIALNAGLCLLSLIWPFPLLGLRWSCYIQLIAFSLYAIQKGCREAKAAQRSAYSFRFFAMGMMALSALLALLSPVMGRWALVWARVCAVGYGALMGIDAFWFDAQNNLVLHSYDRLCVREEEYRLISLYNGKYIMRYQHGRQCLVLRKETAGLLSLPERVENVPASIAAMGRIAPQSRRNWAGLWRDILSGRESGSTIIGYRSPEKGTLWLQTDFITVRDERDKPDHTVLAVYQMEGMQNREKAYRLKRIENDRQAEDGAVYYEVDLSQNRIATLNGTAFYGMPDEPPQRLDDLREALCQNMIPEEYRDTLGKMLDRDQLITEYQQDSRLKRVEFPRLAGGGHQRWTSLEVQMLNDPYSSDVLAFFLFRDVEKEHRKREKQLNHVDELTNLMGRGLFGEKLTELLKEGAAEDRIHVILMIDLDGFKAVNDTFGHAFGDKVLAEVAASLRAQLRGDDLLCRFGGDEFLICLKNVPNDRAFIMQRGSAICQALSRQYGDEVVIGASIGAALYPEHGMDFDTLYRNADQALYQAKKAGRNRCLIYGGETVKAEKNVEEAPQAPLAEAAVRRHALLLMDGGRLDRRAFGDSYRLLEAKNGEEALQTLKTEGSEVSAVIADITAEAAGGMALLQAMRQSPDLQMIPVLVINDASDEALGAKAIKEGATDFIAPPVNDQTLRLLVRNAVSRLDSERLRNQNRELLLKRASETRYQNQLQYVAEHDSVTHIYNKTAFFAKTRALLDQDPATAYCVVCFDVVRFRAVNDIFGHEEGDRLLRYIAMHLQTLVDERGVYARVNTDLFAMCVPYEAHRLREMLKQAEAYARDYDLSFNVQLKFGIYKIDDRSLSINKMLDRAAMAQRGIKGSYLTNYAYYDDSMSLKLYEEQRIINDMASALEKEAFEVFYQPKCRLDTGKMIGAEALVRWRHPERGLLSPKSFIPLFEKNGFIMRLDVYVWERVCRFMGERVRQNPNEDLRVSVNLSRANLYNPGLCATLQGLCQRYSVPCGLLEVEITESAYVENAHLLLDLIDQLHAAGFKVAMDDFGSGYSSLNMLNEIPVDVLKLDMRFLYGLRQDQRGGSILASIMEMTRSLHIDVIAEGVETEEQARFLAAIGCKQAQGFYYHRPMPGGALIERLERERQEETSIMDMEGAKLYLSELLTSAILITQKGDRFELAAANEYYYPLIRVTPSNFSRSDRVLNQWIGKTDAEKLKSAMDEARRRREPVQCLYVQRDLKNGYHLLDAALHYVTDTEDGALYMMILSEKS